MDRLYHRGDDKACHTSANIGTFSWPYFMQSVAVSHDPEQKWVVYEGNDLWYVFDENEAPLNIV